MIIDTSAVLAIILREPEAEAFTRAITEAYSAALPTPAYVEAVLKRTTTLQPALLARLDATILRLRINLVPFTAEHANEAANARRRFGAGRHALNFGDCMVYAVAKLAGAPLLFKGGDFARTDIEPALPATL